MSLEDESHWALLGEAVVGFATRPRRVFRLPQGFHRMPGPALILAESFVDSPVGPFLSLSVGEPARLGMHPGFYFGAAVLNNANARRAGRQYWGYPHELGSLKWISEGNTRGVVWEERGVEVRAEIFGRPLPVLFPLRSIQRRSDGPVVIPAKLKALMRRAHLTLSTTADDPLVAFGGAHRGVALSGMLLRRNAARRPLGWFSTFRPPLRAPEPGVITMDSLRMSRAFADQLQ